MVPYASVPHLFIPGSADGPLGCAPLLAVVDAAAVTMAVQTSLEALLSVLCGFSSGIAGPCVLACVTSRDP